MSNFRVLQETQNGLSVLNLMDASIENQYFSGYYIEDFNIANVRLQDARQGLNIRYISSHDKPEPHEKLYPHDRKAPNIYVVPIATVYWPSTYDEALRLKTPKRYIFHSSHNSGGCEVYNGSVVIEFTHKIQIAEVYCIVHRIDEPTYKEVWYYNKKKEQTTKPVWFPTFTAAKGTLEHIYDTATIEKHYIKM